MSLARQAFLMELLQGRTRVGSIEDLKWIPGRQSFRYEPDFCGRMNVVLEDHSSDRVTFAGGINLVVGAEYTISDGKAQMFRVRILRPTETRHAAIVIDP